MIIEVPLVILIIFLLLLFFLAYKEGKLSAKNKKLRYEVDNKIFRVVDNMKRTGVAAINGKVSKEYGEGWDDCLSHIRNELDVKQEGGQ